MNNKKPIIRNDIFGVNKTPFLNEPKKPFLDDNRTQCLQKLSTFLQIRGFAAIAGQPGNGKTAIVRYFTQTLHKPSHKIVYVPFNNLNENDLLKVICQRLDVTPPHYKNKTIGAIQKRITDIQPINPVIIFDEMQNASPQIMDAIRLLANDDFDSKSKMSIIMIGTNEFFDKLRLAINESLTQRITLFNRIEALNRSSTSNYIKYCLKEAGAEHEIFEEQAVQLIYDISGGAIRIINKLSLAAMSCASEEESTVVTLQHVEVAKQQCLLFTTGVRP